MRISKENIWRKNQNRSLQQLKNNSASMHLTLPDENSVSNIKEGSFH